MGGVPLLIPLAWLASYPFVADWRCPSQVTAHDKSLLITRSRKSLIKYSLAVPSWFLPPRVGSGALGARVWSKNTLLIIKFPMREWERNQQGKVNEYLIITRFAGWYYYLLTKRSNITSELWKKASTIDSPKCDNERSSAVSNRVVFLGFFCPFRVPLTRLLVLGSEFGSDDP